jgi:hypothetical protein
MCEWSDHANCITCRRGGKAYMIASAKHHPSEFAQLVAHEKNSVFQGHTIFKDGTLEDIIVQLDGSLILASECKCSGEHSLECPVDVHQVEALTKLAIGEIENMGKDNGSEKENGKRSPRQQPLPGMVERKIQKIYELAMDYADLRDQRMALGAKEIEKKGQLLDLMKAHKKLHYEYGGVCVDIVHEEETVKVKVDKAKVEVAAEEEAAVEVVEKGPEELLPDSMPLASKAKARAKRSTGPQPVA